MAALSVYLYRARPWDPHLSASDAVAELAREANLRKPYRCEPDQGDEVTRAMIGDVDYVCTPVHYEDGDVDYFVGTNRTRITGITQNAP